MQQHKNQLEKDVCQEKPFPAAALKSLKKSLQDHGNDQDFFTFDPFFRVTVSLDSGQAKPGINVLLPDGGGFNVTKDESKAKVSGDRVKGRIHLPKPQTVFDKQYRFDVKFDVRFLKTES